MTVSDQPLELIYKSRNSLIYYQSDSEYDKPVVIKVLNADYPSPQQLVRFSNEYEFTKDLAIDGVRKAIGQTRLEEKPALILEYINGQTLKQAFVEQKQVLSDFLQVAVHIAKILGELHQHQIIHRDINSYNILVNLETRQVKVIDFGLASRIDLRIQHLGNPERLTGTLAYLSPEQTGRMNRVVDYRTDLYSLGITFYEMLTGHLPFESDDPLALVHAHLAKVPQPVTALNIDVPAMLSGIVMKLLAKNAEDRYQSAFGLQADLERCLANLTDLKTMKNPEGVSFELGQTDYSGQFRIPQKLYGRSPEIEQLLASFERVTAGRQELMLVAGYPGVGKSALVAEVHKPITTKRGYFISGKFDQYQQLTPYSAFSQAFNQLADLLMTERETTWQQWRDEILMAVGSNGGVLTEVIPNLEKVIGPPPAVTKLGGQENRSRFNLTFQDFVQAISTAEHPLVIFIDDWQWADLASLDLLKVLMANEVNTHLLLIGAYRDNEVDGAHPFKLTLNDLTATDATVQTINLDNLKPADVQRLVEESLAVSTADSQALAELVYDKTQGNAFFIHQFLHNLYEQGWLSFDFNTRRWVWDMAHLKAQGITDNVVKLMAGNLKKLSPQTANLLQLAACIGSEFDLQTLALIGRTSEPDTVAGLNEALNEGLLIPLDDFYKLPKTTSQARFSFLHDRIQQAAYNQIPITERYPIHLEIGRLLLTNTPAARLEQRIFEIVQHYNRAGVLIITEAERQQVADLNIQAADLASGAAAFKSAQTYLETALALMPVDVWTSHYDQMLRLHSQLASTLALTGNFEQLDQVVETTESQANTLIETAQVKQAKIRGLLSRGSYIEAVEFGLDFIEMMGVSIERDPSATEALVYLKETGEWLTEAKIESIPNFPAAPPEVGLVLEVASVLCGPAYVTNPNLHVMFVSRITRLCIEQGLAPGATTILGNFAMLLSAALHNVSKARLLMDTTRQLVEVKYHSDSLITALNALSASLIIHRYDHLKHTLPILAEGIQKGLASGNFELGGFCVLSSTWHHLLLGTPLAHVEAVSQQAAETCQKMQQLLVKDWCLLVHQVTLNLQGKGETPWILKGDAYDEEAQLSFSLQINNFAEVFRIFFSRGWLHYLFDQPQTAADLFRKAEPHLAADTGMYRIPLFYLYDTLANAAIYNQYGPKEQVQILERINHNLKEFEVWLRFAPMNHQHKKDLMEAEKARIEGRYWEAMTAYQKAIQGARDNEFLHEEALANELYGQFWVDQNNKEIAGVYLQKAQYLYSLWGAKAKFEQLQAKATQILGPQQGSLQSVSDTIEVTSTSHSPASSGEATKGWLDINSVLKANQTLSQTVQLDDLLTEMIKILLENAGAERALVLYQGEDNWFIEAEGQAQETIVQTRQHWAHSEPGRLSLSVFNYVIHSGKAVVLVNATQDPQFAADVYLQEQEIKSVLCLPILHQGQLKLVLYLENNLTEAAFTESRLELLKMLSVQMAISLENALMVDSLETSIAERERAEEMLRLTRFSVDSVADAVYWMDSEGRIVDVNETACFMLGYTRQELTQMSVPDIDPEISVERWAGTWKHIKENGKLVLETSHRTKDGRVIAVELIANYIQFGDYELDCAIVRDISERKQTEEALRQSEERLQQAVRASNIGIFDHDHLTDTIYWSPKQRQNYGWGPEETVTLSKFLEQVYPEDGERIGEAVRRAHNPAGDGLFDVEHRIVRRDGAVRWLATRSQTFFEGEGNARHLVRTVGAVLDVTEAKEAEEALRVKDKAIASAINAIVIAGADGNVTYVNPSFLRVWGYDNEQEVLGKSAQKLWTHPKEEALRVTEAMLLEGSWIGEVSARKKDGSWFEAQLSASLVKDQLGEPTYLMGSLMDITERKQVEEKIHQLNQELEQRVIERTAQLEAANEELEAFSYSVSHDLRAPLRAIDGYTRILVEDFEPSLDTEGKRVCNVIRDQTQQMGELIDDLLTFSRLSRAEMRMSPIDMEALGRSIFHELTTPETQGRIDFLLDPIPPAFGDPALIRQVWINLLSNAIKFSANRERAVIKVSSVQQAGETIYSVRDNGAGYDMRYADKLFGVFQRLHSKREFEGTGVGLAIIQRIIHRHGGQVWAEAEVDNGATFYFTLPQQETDNEPS